MVFLTEQYPIKNLPQNYLLYFYSTWMPNSVNGAMTRLLDKSAIEFDVPVFGIDVDAYKSLVKVYDIKRVPAIALFRDQQVVKKIEGLLLTSSFRATLREVYGS